MLTSEEVSEIRKVRLKDDVGPKIELALNLSICGTEKEVEDRVYGILTSCAKKSPIVGSSFADFQGKELFVCNVSEFSQYLYFMYILGVSLGAENFNVFRNTERRSLDEIEEEERDDSRLNGWEGEEDVNGVSLFQSSSSCPEEAEAEGICEEKVGKRKKKKRKKKKNLRRKQVYSMGKKQKVFLSLKKAEGCLEKLITELENHSKEQIPLPTDLYGKEYRAERFEKQLDRVRDEIDKVQTNRFEGYNGFSIDSVCNIKKCNSLLFEFRRNREIRKIEEVNQEKRRKIYNKQLMAEINRKKGLEKRASIAAGLAWPAKTPKKVTAAKKRKKKKKKKKKVKKKKRRVQSAREYFKTDQSDVEFDGFYTAREKGLEGGVEEGCVGEKKMLLTIDSLEMTPSLEPPAISGKEEEDVVVGKIKEAKFDSGKVDSPKQPIEEDDLNSSDEMRIEKYLNELKDSLIKETVGVDIVEVEWTNTLQTDGRRHVNTQTAKNLSKTFLENECIDMLQRELEILREKIQNEKVKREQQEFEKLEKLLKEKEAKNQANMESKKRLQKQQVLFERLKGKLKDLQIPSKPVEIPLITPENCVGIKEVVNKELDEKFELQKRVLAGDEIALQKLKNLNRKTLRKLKEVKTNNFITSIETELNDRDERLKEYESKM